MSVNVIRINELPEGSGNLTNDDIFIFMDDPLNSGVSKKISLAEISSNITNGIDQTLDLKLNASEVDTDLIGGPGISLLYNNSNNALSIFSNNEKYITALGTLTGTNAINYNPSDRSIQTLTLNGTPVTFTKGTGWPTASNVSVDTILKITVTVATTITWNIVNDWFAQPPSGALSAGTHLFLLRAVGSSIIEGHYIGNKTN